MRTLLILATSLALAASLSAQTLTGFGVIKTSGFTQTSNSAPTASGAAINAYVFGTGLSGHTYTFTPPGGGNITTPRTLTLDGSDMKFSADFANVAALNADYANGAYSMALPNSGSPTSWTLQSLTGDAYVTAPTITGTWSGGLLQIDPTQSYILTFAAFSGFNTNDSISLSIDGIGTSYFANTSVTTFTINAGTLTAGTTYDASLRFNNNFIDMAAIGSANANAGYTTETSFQIQAVPEPSTYAAIFGALALGAAMIQRRRQRQA